MLNGPFPSWPSFTEEEANAVKAVLLSNRVNYWTGERGYQFEQAFAEYTQVKHAIALANGTVALELALKALEIGEGDEVIVTPRTFIASVSAIIQVGAKPVFADVDFNSQNITAETIEAVLTPKTRAVICVHLAGWPCDMAPILALARQRDIRVIEDCAQAHGAVYQGQSVGGIGDIGCWSFCQDKIMTTGGEGGMITTNDKDLWSKLWSMKDHGKSWESVFKRSHPEGFRWLHDSFGTNARMTEMQAEIGLIQLKKMPFWHAQRHAHANAIWQAAKDIEGLRAPTLNDLPNYHDSKHAAYKCYVFIEGDSDRRDQVLAQLKAQEIPCFVGSCPEVYLEKAFDGMSYKPKISLPIAKTLGETSLMFLCHPTLMQSHIKQTCDALKTLTVNRKSAHSST